MRCFLKTVRESIFRSEMGREFQIVGPETAKDLYPHDLRVNLGSERRRAFCDLSVLEGLYGLRREERYGGAAFES